MRNFQLALVACSLLACEAAPPATPMTESDVSLALAPLPCGAPLPPMTSWNGKAPSPLPLPETEQGVVLIVDHPSDDQLRWAFSVDVDQITGWAELRADRVGELVRLVESAKQGVADFVVFIPILSIVKVRPPMGPRLSDYVLANAALQREIDAAARAHVDQCDQTEK